MKTPSPQEAAKWAKEKAEKLYLTGGDSAPVLEDTSGGGERTRLC